MTKPILAIFSVFIAALLAGCGGLANNVTLISGVAATGDIAGTTGIAVTNLGIANGVVTIEDIAGHTSTAATDSFGNYSFNAGQLSGWIPPYMMRVSYQSGGVTHYLHSAALIADLVSGNATTINITPLTDLAIANAAGETAAYAFSNFASLNGKLTAGMATGVTALDAQLVNVLTAFGVAGVDLVHYPFTADTSSGYDEMLAALRVVQDPATLTATISNRLTGSSVTDDLTVAPNPTPTTTILSNAAVTSAAGSPAIGDLQGIQNFFSSFSSVMAQASPATNAFFTTNLANFDLTNFKHNGQNFTAFLNALVAQITSNPGDVMSFGDIILDTAPALPTSIVPALAASYKVHFTIFNNGYPSAREEFILYRNNGATNWIAVGNQHVVKARMASLETSRSAFTNNCTGLQPQINDKTGAGITYAVMSGPGLPTNGLLLFANGSPSGDLAIADPASADPTTYVGTTPTALANACGFPGLYPLQSSDIAGMVAAAATGPLTYNVSLYDNVSYSPSNTPVASYTSMLDALPLTSTQLTTGAFASGEAESPSVLSQAQISPSGGSSTISWSVPAAANLPSAPNPAAPIAPYLYASAIAVSAGNGVNSAYNSVDILGNVASAAVPVPYVSSAISAGVTIQYIDHAFRNYWAGF